MDNFLFDVTATFQEILKYCFANASKYFTHLIVFTHYYNNGFEEDIYICCLRLRSPLLRVCSKLAPIHETTTKINFLSLSKDLLTKSPKSYLISLY